jgi:hypothetical protein
VALSGFVVSLSAMARTTVRLRSDSLSGFAGIRTPIPEADKPGLAEVFVAAFRTQNTLGAIMSAEYAFTAGDDTPSLSGSQIEANLVKDKLTGMRHKFMDVRNQAQYDAMRADLARETADARTLNAAGGMASLIAGLTVGLADPINVLPGVGGAAKAVAIGKGATRAAIEGAALGGVSALATEAVMSKTRQTHTTAEGIAGVGASVVLGGMFGAGIYKFMGPHKLAQVEARMSRDMADLDTGSPRMTERVQNFEKAIADEVEAMLPSASKSTSASADNSVGAASVTGQRAAEINFGVNAAGGDFIEHRLKVLPFADKLPDVEGLLKRDVLPDALRQHALTKGAVGFVHSLQHGIPISKLIERMPELAKQLGPIGKWVGEAITMPRMVLQKSDAPMARAALGMLDDGTYITKANVAGQASHPDNVMTTLADLRGKFATGQAEAERIWRDARVLPEWAGDGGIGEKVGGLVNGGTPGDHAFGLRVAKAMINGDRDHLGDKNVEGVAQALRNGVYGPTLKYFQDHGVFSAEAGGTVRNADSYLPIVYNVPVVQERSVEFISRHVKAFEAQLLEDHGAALLAHKDAITGANAARDAAIAEARVVADEAVAKLKTEYGSVSAVEGKIKDAISDGKELVDRLKLEFRDKRASGNWDERMLGAEKQKFAQAVDEAKIAAKKKADDLTSERDAKIKDAKAEVAKAGFVARTKALENVPEYDKAILRKYGIDKNPDDAIAFDAETLARAHFEGITQNQVSVNLDHEMTTPGLRNVLKGRQGNVAQIELMEAGFLESNPMRIAEQYHRRAAPDAALARAFKKTVEVDLGDGVKEMRLVGDITMSDVLKRTEAHYKNQMALTSSGPELQALTDKMSMDIAALSQMRDFLRGAPTLGSSLSMRLQEATPYLMAYNSMRTMGGTVLGSVGDPINLVVANGFGNAVKYGFGPAFSDFRNAAAHGGDMGKLNRWLGAAIEFESNSAMAVLMDAGNAMTSQSRGAQAMERLTKTFWTATGLTHWTSTMKNIAANVTHARIATAAVEGWEKQGKATQVWLANLGIDAPMLGKIAAEYDKQPVKAFGGRGDIPAGDPRVWTDVAAIDAYRGAIFRESHNVVVTPTHADKLSFQNTPHGQLIMQLRNFGVAAQGKLLARNAALGSLDGDHAAGMYTGLMMLVGMGVVSEFSKSFVGDVTLTGDSKSKPGSSPTHRFMTKLEKTPGELVYNVLDRSIPLFHLMELSNIAHKIGIGGGIDVVSALARDEKDARAGSSRFRGRGAFESVFGPTAGLIETAPKALAGFGNLLPGGDKPSRQDFQSVRSLVPFQNAVPFQQLFNTMEGKLGNAYEWPLSK